MSVINQQLAKLIKENLREIPDFPKEGILFRDISPLLGNGQAFKELVKGLAEKYRGKIDVVAGLESRGFILAAPLALELGIGMIPVRKGGKLPGPVIGVDYQLEYGTARLELRPEMVKENERVLIIDDVLATGGTAAAAVKLIRQCGAKVESVLVLMELAELNGKSKLPDVDVEALVSF